MLRSLFTYHPKCKLLATGLFLLFLFSNKSYAGSTFDWVGGSQTGGIYSWINPLNWKVSGATTLLYPGEATGDVANFGVNSTFTTQPTLSATLANTVANIYFGPNGTSYSGETLTVTGVTLTAAAITVNHGTGTNGFYGGYTCTIAGTGTVICTGNFSVGNTTQPAGDAANLTYFSSQVTQLTVDGNLILIAEGDNGNGQNYPEFALDNNKVTLVGQFVTESFNNPLSGSYANNNNNDPGIGKFSLNNTTNTTTLELQNLIPIQDFLANMTIDFDDGGGGSSTVIYDAASGSQRVYTFADYPYIGHSPDDYQNLTLSGASTKVFDGTSVNVGVNLNSSGGTVDWTSNDPAVTVGGNWTNATTITEGAGAVSVAGSLTNNAGGIINGNTSASANTTITGILTNSGTITANQEVLTFTGAATNNSIITGGPNTLTFSSSLLNTAGTITTGSGTTTVGNSLQTTGGAVNFGSGTANITPSVQMNGGTLTCSTGTVNIANALQVNSGTCTGPTTGGVMNVAGPFTSSGTFNPGIGTDNFSGTYNNTGTFQFAAGTMVFKGASSSASPQTIKDGSAGGTTFNNVIFNGSGTAPVVSITAGTGNFSVASTGTLLMDSPTQLIAGTTTVGGVGYLTLLSNTSGSAIVEPITGSSVITGNVNVQRYITGGASTYRGYRLLSSQVNISNLTSQSGTEGYLGLSYLNAGMLTGGPGTGFDVVTTNPLTYFYNETRPHNVTAYIAGKNVGVYAITTSTGSPAYSITTYGTTLTSKTTGVQVPVGNSCEVYFVGNTSNTTSSTIPNSATVTALGYLNQGTIPVYVFNGISASKTMTYTTGTGVPVAGLQQVGNPYASTIDLDSLYYDNNTLSPIFYELKTPSSAFVSYNAASHTVSGSAAGAYIVSGEGFVVGALASPTVSTITFYEKEKVNVQLTSSTTPPLILSQKQKMATTTAGQLPELSSTSAAPITATEVLPSGLIGLHLQLSQDSVTNIQTGIYFSNSWSDNYVASEDAKDISTAAIALSSYSLDTQRLCINQMSSYLKGKTIKLYTAATTNGTYSISLADIKNIDAVYSVFLRDHKLDDSVDLRITNSYSFAINNSDTTSFGANRFDVVIELKQLPQYQLLSFNGQKVTKGVQLNWQTLNPGDYTSFTLQKEESNGTYSPIYTTQSNNSTSYNYIDTDPVTGNNTYRLAQSDFYGNITYSQPVTIGYENVSSNGLLQIYPNPATVLINIKVNPTSSTLQDYTADIYSSSGTKMEHRSLNTYSWTDDISSYMQGVYIMVLKDNSGNVLGKTKFIKTQ